MKLIIRLLLTALAVVVLAHLLPQVSVDGYVTAIIVAVVVGLLDFIVKPVLVVLTLPVTVLTLGLFLWIINAFIIWLADYFVPGFRVSDLLWTLIFALLLSLLQSLFHAILKVDK